MNKYEALSLVGLMLMHPYMFFFGIKKEISDLSYVEIEDILIYLGSLSIPFKILFDLFDEQYDTWHDDEFTYPIDYFIVEENDKGCRIGIFSKRCGSVAWLDEYGKWKLDEKYEYGNSCYFDEE